MDKKLFILILVSVLGFGTLIFSASRTAAKEVVTVAQLVSEGEPVTNVRLGARVSSRDIDYDTSGPEFKVGFKVVDIPEADDNSNSQPLDQSRSISVVYYGIKPDTLQPGRDVILEGSFQENGLFTASTLLTQCPSKYEPPSVTAPAEEGSTAYMSKGL